MIIEYFGLPGSGKTTFCNRICNEQHLKNPRIFFKDNLFGKILFHIFLNTFYINYSLLKKYKEGKKILSNKKYVNKINPNISIELYLKYIVFIFYIENRYDAIVLDEGVIHYLTALYAEFEVDFDLLDDIYKIFKVIDKDIVYKSTNCDISKAIENCKKRNRKDAPIDFLNDDELYSIENRYKQAEEYYSKHLN